MRGLSNFQCILCQPNRGFSLKRKSFSMINFAVVVSQLTTRGHTNITSN